MDDAVLHSNQPEEKPERGEQEPSGVHEVAEHVDHDSANCAAHPDEKQGQRGRVVLRRPLGFNAHPEDAAQNQNQTQQAHNYQPEHGVGHAI